MDDERTAHLIALELLWKQLAMVAASKLGLSAKELGLAIADELNNRRLDQGGGLSQLDRRAMHIAAGIAASLSNSGPIEIIDD